MEKERKDNLPLGGHPNSLKHIKCIVYILL